MKGNMGIGAISDGDPQPLTVYSRQGDYAISDGRDGSTIKMKSCRNC